jgi:hypothetical protein
VAPHASQQFVAFLGEVVANQRPRKEIHIVADNLSTHIVNLTRTRSPFFNTNCLWHRIKNQFPKTIWRRGFWESTTAPGREIEYLHQRARAIGLRWKISVTPLSTEDS